MIAPPTLDWLAFQRVRFEKDRGVTSVTTRGGFTSPEIGLDSDRTAQQLRVYQVLADMQERVIRTNNDVDAELSAAQDKAQKLLDDNRAKQPELYLP